MVKKIIASILCLFLITISIAPVTAMGDDTDFKENLLQIEQKISLMDEEDLDPFIYHTAGPASEKYSEVELLGGSPEEIQKIEKHLNKSLLSSVFLPYILVFVSTPLNFTVSYFEEARDGSRYSYHTYFANATYDDEGNMGDTENDTMITNEIHKMKVENFTGVFLYARAKLFRPPTYYIRPLFLPMLFSIIYYNCAKLFFIPARFSFIGSCDNITQIPIFK